MWALVVAAISLQAAQKAEVIQGASGARSEGLEVHAGGLVVRQGEAGAAFGTMRLGTLQRQVAYFVVLKHRLGPGSPLELSEEASCDGTTGSGKQAIAIAGNSLLIDYLVRLEEKGKGPGQETLAVNGKNVDLARGRVLLVDLTANPPRWEQRKVDLPSEVNEVASKKGAEELARKVLGELVKKDRKTREFVEAARR